MRDVPIFIPYGDQRLAGVVTLPEGTPRGLVLLLQGLGAPRSHKYGLWTRTARALADRGFASLRIDYQMLGDSTGSLLADLHRPPVDEALAAARVVARHLSVEAVATIGNCMGGRTALGVAEALPSCRSVTCILPGNLDAIVFKSGERATGPVTSRARRVAARIPRLKKLVRRMRRKRSQIPVQRFTPTFRAALTTARVRLLYLGTEEAYDRLVDSLDQLGAPDDGDRGLRTDLIPAAPITSFRLPIDLQPQVIEAVVAWLDETLPHPPPDVRPDAPRTGVREEATRT
jgi:pimeloyl-ACP methyl ester carboxylesterase